MNSTGLLCDAGRGGNAVEETVQFCPFAPFRGWTL